MTGHLQKVTVDVLNGKAESFKTMPVDLVPLLSQEISAYTVNKVMGDMQVIDWTKNSAKWPHLRGIEFHKSAKLTVDILIG